jgi:hypothetical protein
MGDEMSARANPSSAAARRLTWRAFGHLLVVGSIAALAACSSPSDETCGNATCDPDETLESCPQDCADICGNALCEFPETQTTCPQDCKPSNDAGGGDDADAGGGGGGSDADAGGADDDAGGGPGDAGGEPDTGGGDEICEFAGEFGCECDSNNECVEGFCIDSPLGKVCTKICQDSCPLDWACKQAGAGDPTFICLPTQLNLCRPCSSHEQCKDAGTGDLQNFCVPFEDTPGVVNGSFCGIGCDEKDIGTAGDCPAGFECEAFDLPNAGTVTQCVPSNDDTGVRECECTDAWMDLQLQTACSVTNEWGTCEGYRQCTVNGEGQLTFCSAATPQAETCGDGIDNDCDGETDEADAVGCTVYYADNDGDGYGIGVGECLCNAPGAGYAAGGGDCDDVVQNINPAATEVCNAIDDNCNGSTDEAGASGCQVFYQDKDGDGYGDPNDAGCFCAVGIGPNWIAQEGDCDDKNFDVKPGVAEVCGDSIDNNCNQEVDEENAEGCAIYYIDNDNDGYGSLDDDGKCLCGKNALFKVDVPGDCDDGNPNIYPTKKESCDNVDEDCNGSIDDNVDVAAFCPPILNATPACQAGKCVIGSCPQGLFDVDGIVDNGCECMADNNFGKAGGSCQAAINGGNLAEGGKLIYTGNVMPTEDSGDWYTINAVDSSDTEGGCDNFNVRARFLQNPGNEFVIDLYRGSCAGASQLCTSETDTMWGTYFYGVPFGPGALPGSPGGTKTPPAKGGKPVKSPNPLPAGECKCSFKTGEQGPGVPGMNQCKDNGAKFYVRVYRKPGLAASCNIYQLEITNGTYPTTK